MFSTTILSAFDTKNAGVLIITTFTFTSPAKINLSALRLEQYPKCAILFAILSVSITYNPITCYSLYINLLIKISNLI